MAKDDAQPVTTGSISPKDAAEAKIADFEKAIQERAKELDTGRLGRILKTVGIKYKTPKHKELDKLYGADPSKRTPEQADKLRADYQVESAPLLNETVQKMRTEATNTLNEEYAYLTDNRVIGLDGSLVGQLIREADSFIETENKNKTVAESVLTRAAADPENLIDVTVVKEKIDKLYETAKDISSLGGYLTDIVGKIVKDRNQLDPKEEKTLNEYVDMFTQMQRDLQKDELALRDIKKMDKDADVSTEALEKLMVTSRDKLLPIMDKANVGKSLANMSWADQILKETQETASARGIQ
jgi:hypothetical protein